MPSLCRAALAVGVLAIVVSGLGSALASSTGPARAQSRVASAPDLGSNVSVEIDPASWWMESGANVTLAASWVEAPAGCSLAPSWFRWTIAPGGSEGTVVGTNGSRTVFFASNAGTGTTTLVVDAAASLDCRGNETATFSRGTSVITVAGPLSMSDVAAAKDPVAPGSPTGLEGTLVGGDPPYHLRAEWGDGSVSYANVSTPGPFSMRHTYLGEGAFEPLVLATDAAGHLDQGDLDGPLYVSGTFSAAIAPSTFVADVGTPVLFGIRTLDAPSAFSSLFACGDAVPANVGASVGLDYGCAFDSAGVAPISFEAVGASPPFPVVNARLDEQVVPPPSIGFPAPPPLGEVNGTLYAPLQLSDGVAPFTLHWSLVGTGAVGTATVPSDGTAYLLLRPDLAGAFLLSVVGSDALDVATPPIAEVIDVTPALAVWATAGSETVGNEVAVNLNAGAFEGTPPFDWTVVPGAPATNGSTETGFLAGPGSFAWNATYRAEGSLNVAVEVVDSAGGSAEVNLDVLLVPSLSVSAEVDAVGPGFVSLRVSILGGQAPFSYRWNDSAGESWNGSVPVPGTSVLREATQGSGRCSFDLRVVDALGASVTEEFGENLTAPEYRLAPDPGAVEALLGTTLVAMVAAALFLFRRRRRAVSPAPPDPVAVLRETIEPSDGVDRGLVELLAEERGLSLEVVRATLERLKAEGTVRAGRGSDGEEVLAWVDPPSR